VPIRPVLPQQPELGDTLSSTHESAETLRLLALRRSTPVAMIGGPGPAQEDIDLMLSCALRVPDHRKLEPWRVLVIEGEARNRLGSIFAAVKATSDPNATAQQIEADRALPLRAPVILCVISSPVQDVKGTPEWEQRLSAGALCQNILIAAAAAGWAACWLTEWPAFDGQVGAALGLRGDDRIAGFIYLGTAKEQPVERQRPDMSNRVIRWGG
jgi:nitroreductase